MYQQFPPPPAPSRTPKGLIIGLIAGGVALALLACGVTVAGSLYVFANERKNATALAEQKQHGAKPIPEKDEGHTHSGDLRILLIDPPNGSRPWVKPLGTDGELSLDQAAAISSNKEGRAKLLKQYGFMHGAFRGWHTDADVIADVRLYQFDSSAHARLFALLDQIATQKTFTEPSTSIDGVPGASVFTKAKDAKTGYQTSIAIGYAGDLVFVVELAMKTSVDQAAVVDLVKQQYGRL